MFQNCRTRTVLMPSTTSTVPLGAIILADVGTLT